MLQLQWIVLALSVAWPMRSLAQVHDDPNPADIVPLARGTFRARNRCKGACLHGHPVREAADRLATLATVAASRSAERRSGPRSRTVLPACSRRMFQEVAKSSARRANGCPPGIRTPIERFRVVGPTIERGGNAGECKGPRGTTRRHLCECNGWFGLGQTCGRRGARRIKPWQRRRCTRL